MRIRRLEFKCSPVCSLCCASVLTVLVIIGCLIGSILAFLFDGFRNFAVVALIGGSIIICIWIIMLISLLFRKHVVVTDDEIKVYKGLQQFCFYFHFPRSRFLVGSFFASTYKHENGAIIRFFPKVF